MQTKKILTTLKQIKTELSAGNDVFVGQYLQYNKQISPSDKLIVNGDGFIQEGVERNGIPFSITKENVQYTIDDYACMLEKGCNLKGGNVCFVFFQYEEEKAASNSAVYIESLEGEKATIEVVECSCGYHMGFDSSFLDQVSNMKASCPSCGAIIDTALIPEISYDDCDDEREGEYRCIKCDRWFTDEDIETFSPCVCKVCAQN